MNRCLLLILGLMTLSLQCLAQTGEIYGTVLDETRVSFGGVKVAIHQAGRIKGRTVTEDDGTYSLKPLRSGTYSVTFSMKTYIQTKVMNVVVGKDGRVKLDMRMEPDVKSLEEMTVTNYRKQVSGRYLSPAH